MEYTTKDLILPNLKLPEPCPIKITTDDKYIRLFVGQRDWQWRLDGSMVGAGTGLCQSVEETEMIPFEQQTPDLPELKSGQTIL